MDFTVAVKIWARTILVSAIVTAFAVPPGVLLIGIWEVLMALPLELIVTFPLLLLVAPLVKLSTKLPYSRAAKIFWLWFNLEVLIVFFYILFFRLSAMLYHFSNETVCMMILTTSTGLLLAMLWSQKSLKTIITDKQ